MAMKAVESRDLVGSYASCVLDKRLLRGSVAATTDDPAIVEFYSLETGRTSVAVGDLIFDEGDELGIMESCLVRFLARAFESTEEQAAAFVSKNLFSVDITDCYFDGLDTEAKSLEAAVREDFSYTPDAGFSFYMCDPPVRAADVREDRESDLPAETETGGYHA